MLDAIARIPMGVRVAILAVAGGLAVAATVAHDDRSSGEGGVAGATRHSSYLGPRIGAASWMPSRPKRHSVVWAIGDGADGGSASRAVAAMVAARRADRLLYLGDVYETGTSAEFRLNYRPAYGRFDSITAPTIGNHEWPNVATGYVPYWSSVRGAPPPLWYAFAVSGWQLISLDSNAPTSPDQLGWLRNEIRSTPRYGNCRIVFMHHPFFSAGLHGDLTALQSVFGELRGHATIALAGHDHDMQRLRPSQRDHAVRRGRRRPRPLPGEQRRPAPVVLRRHPPRGASTRAAARGGDRELHRPGRHHAGQQLRALPPERSGVAGAVPSGAEPKLAEWPRPDPPEPSRQTHTTMGR